MRTWYEVFEDLIDGTKGTRTLEICKTLREARKERKYYLKTGLWEKKDLHIDKWKNTDNPKIIRNII